MNTITKYGQLEKLLNGVPIAEGSFKTKENRMGRVKPGDKDFQIKDEPTAKCLWQAELATGDYRADETDVMLTGWLKHPLTTAFNATEQLKGKKDVSRS